MAGWDDAPKWDDAAKYLNLLFKHANPNHFLEIRAFGPGKPVIRFFRVAEVKQALNWLRRNWSELKEMDVCVGVNPRVRSSGRIEDVDSAYYLVADMDYKVQVDPTDEEVLEISQKGYSIRNEGIVLKKKNNKYYLIKKPGKEFLSWLNEKLKLLGVKPAMVIDSGFGYHVYIRITKTSPEKWRELQILLNSYLGADEKIKDPARVMGLAGTINNGYSLRRLRWIVHSSEEKPADPDALLEKLRRVQLEYSENEEGDEAKERAKSEEKESGKVLLQPVEHLPPCIIQAMELTKQDKENHYDNVLIRDFFMTIWQNKGIETAEERLIRLFKDLKGRYFDQKETERQVRHWKSKRYLPENCNTLKQRCAGKEENKKPACPGCELEGRIRNPLTYYRFKSRRLFHPNPVEKIEEPVPEEIRIYTPLKTFRKDQLRLINKACELIKAGKDFILNPPTGYGKTHVFLIASRISGLRTVVVEPDRGLQNQLEEYGCVVIKGKGNYSCNPYNLRADEAPCSVMQKFECNEYCEWKEAVENAKKTLEERKPVVVNFGNMYWAENAELIVIDEFHKVLDELSNPVEIKFRDGDSSEIIDYNLLLAQERLEELYVKIESVKVGSKEYLKLAREIIDLKEKVNRLYFIRDNIIHSIFYRKGSKFFVELDLVGVARYIDKRYAATKIWVSATPVNFKDMPVLTTDYRVARKENAPIMYLPVAKLTTASLNKTEGDLIELAADVICLIFEHYRSITKKAVIHTGNTKKHMKVADHLEKRGYKVVKHERGRIEESISKFKSGNYDFLAIAAADAGYDFSGPDIALQFILKIPYPNVADPKWRAMEKQKGKEKADEEYELRTVNSILQICGRICRSEDDVGVTVILDEKFEELFWKRREWFGKEFEERLYGLG